ncbi:MAG: hypothetical protein PHH57_08345 [Candidatus Omnitrophica bacterium]|nr:hypothetical protein [Candidatus Omnitrophota bacterium]
MLRKYISMILLVSLFALGSSGLLMMFNHDFGFQLRMHPVHEVFGVMMCLSAVFHVCFNFRPMISYLKKRQIVVAGMFLTSLLIFLYAVGLHRPIDPAFVDKIEGVMLELRHQR